jgi:hypothetical protein
VISSVSSTESCFSRFRRFAQGLTSPCGAERLSDELLMRRQFTLVGARERQFFNDLRA